MLCAFFASLRCPDALGLRAVSRWLMEAYDEWFRDKTRTLYVWAGYELGPRAALRFGDADLTWLLQRAPRTTRVSLRGLPRVELHEQSIFAETAVIFVEPQLGLCARRQREHGLRRLWDGLL